MNEQRIIVGTFTQVSDRMRASDPCYDKDVWCAHYFDRVYKETQERVLAAESYEEALAIISEKVNLIDETPAE